MERGYMKKLYLHIGTAKTGSSALQSFFYLNADTLEKKGIYYPLEYGGAPINQFQLSGGNLGPLVLEKDGHDNELVEAVAKLLEGHDTLLFSTEYLWDHFEARMGIFEGIHELDCETEIVVYLRPQVEFIESMYREAVENLCCVTDELEVFLEAARMNAEEKRQPLLDAGGG